MILLDRRVHEGVMPPRFYGLAYRDIALREGHYYPVPLNWFVQWGRSFWFWLKRGPGSNAIDQAKRQGWMDAMDFPETVRNRNVVRRLRAWRTNLEALVEENPVGDSLIKVLNDMLGEEGT